MTFKLRDRNTIMAITNKQMIALEFALGRKEFTRKELFQATGDQGEALAVACKKLGYAMRSQYRLVECIRESDYWTSRNAKPFLVRKRYISVHKIPPSKSLSRTA